MGCLRCGYFISFRFQEVSYPFQLVTLPGFQAKHIPKGPCDLLVQQAYGLVHEARLPVENYARLCLVGPIE